MQLSSLLTDDDAVSPVIGVILMVAITVILAAVIGAFVLGFGGGGDAAPSVQWQTEAAENGTSGEAVAVFEHGGGDTISDASVLEAGGVAGSSDELKEWNGSHVVGSAIGSSTELRTGDAIGVNVGASTSGEVTLIWNNPDDDSTQQLAAQNV